MLLPLCNALRLNRNTTSTTTSGGAVPWHDCVLVATNLTTLHTAVLFAGDPSKSWGN